MFYVITGRSARPTPFGEDILVFTFLLAAFGNRRPPVAPSFVARRKMGEKGVPRRRKLHILRFAFRGKSSVVPLLLLSPPNPLTLGFGGAPIGGPLESPGINVDSKPDVLCAYVFATVRVTRLSRLRRAQAHCFRSLCVPHSISIFCKISPFCA